MPRTIAFVLYASGIVIAISGAAKVPQDAHRWPDTLPWFLAGVVLAGVGLVCWRMGLKAKAAQDNDGRQSVEGLFRYLRECRREATAIAEQFSGLDADALRQRIDEMLTNYIEPFVEGRYTLIEHYGMKEGAEIMLQLSLAERNFNRVWSAAADSCLPEAHASLAKARAALEDVVEPEQP